MILKEYKSNLDKFNEIYEKDRYLARIYFLEKSPSVTYTVLNEVSKDVFQIFETTHKYGVSKTLKRYVSKRDNKKIFVNKNRFFIMINRGSTKLFPLSLISLDREYLPMFIERFSWIRFLEENGFNTIPFNTIVSKKLYSRDKVLKYLYSCPPDIGLLLKSKVDKHEWNKISKSSFNVENLNKELLNDLHYLMDTCRLAFKLNERVNLAWSKRRLIEEHDKWSQTYTKHVIEMDNEPLNIRQVFRDFNDFIGGGLITESGQLAQEGYNQRHCVASYKHQINTGSTSIFHIQGYTAEIRTGYSSEGGIALNQFRGLRNVNAPIDLQNDLTNKIEQFNKSIKGKEYQPHVLPKTYLQVEEEMPF